MAGNKRVTFVSFLLSHGSAETITPDHLSFAAVLYYYGGVALTINFVWLGDNASYIFAMASSVQLLYCHSKSQCKQLSMHQGQTCWLIVFLIK